jgi:hypothetical protein
MKKINNIAIWLCFASSALFSGCNDFLDVKSDTLKQGSESFRNIEDLRAITASIYTAPWFLFNSSSMQALDGRYNNILSDASSSTYFPYAGFSLQSGTVGVENVWNSLYNVISQCSYVINDYAPTAREHIDDEAAVNACEGEARFMRGLAYWYLAMLWHDVPVVDDARAHVLNTQMSPVYFEDVLNVAILDLEYAAQWLPATNDKGRLTVYGGKAGLARVYLTAANYAMGNRFTSEYLLRNGYGSNSQIAEWYLAQVMELTDQVLTSGTQYGLMADYEQLFRVQNNNNIETLFGIQFVPLATTNGLGNSRQDNLASSSALTGGLNAWGNVYCGYDLTYWYVTTGALSRMRGNIFVKGQKYDYLGTHTATGSWTPTATKCNVKKFVVGSNQDTEGVAINGNSGQVTPLLRLADVYLMYAEAAIGPTASSTTDALALQRFNKVRERAFYLNPEDYVPYTEITRNDILKERRMEFFMEAQSWTDVVRRSFHDMDWVLKYLNNKLQDEDPDTDFNYHKWGHYTLDPAAYPATGGFNNSPRYTTGLTTNDAVHHLPVGSFVHSADASDNIWSMPYPQTEADKNPLLNKQPVNYDFSKNN